MIVLLFYCHSKSPLWRIIINPMQSCNWLISVFCISIKSFGKMELPTNSITIWFTFVLCQMQMHKTCYGKMSINKFLSAVCISIEKLTFKDLNFFYEWWLFELYEIWNCMSENVDSVNAILMYHSFKYIIDRKFRFK